MLTIFAGLCDFESSLAAQAIVASGIRACLISSGSLSRRQTAVNQSFWFFVSIFLSFVIRHPNKLSPAISLLRYIPSNMSTEAVEADLGDIRLIRSREHSTAHRIQQCLPVTLLAMSAILHKSRKTSSRWLTSNCVVLRN
jgi:hypothetical protein